MCVLFSDTLGMPLCSAQVYCCRCIVRVVRLVSGSACRASPARARVTVRRQRGCLLTPVGGVLRRGLQWESCAGICWRGGASHGGDGDGLADGAAGSTSRAFNCLAWVLLPNMPVFLCFCSFAVFKPHFVFLKYASSRKMYYLVHLPTQHRPYITTLPYIALDFRKWGYRVDTYANDSKYIAEIRSREKAIKWKVELSEMWAREIVTRMRQDRERGNSDDGAYPEIRGLSTEERRYERASRIVQHFIDALAAFGMCDCR